MNGQNFSKWLQEKLLPNLEGPSAIVMDNASYHSSQSERCPTSNTRKADIQEWLHNHRITYTKDIMRPQLLELVRIHKPPPCYVIDDIVRRNRHEGLRLPPYRLDFNAIELIWSHLKRVVFQQSGTFRLDHVLEITQTPLEEIGEERRCSACEHLEGIINQHKKNDHYIDDIAVLF